MKNSILTLLLIFVSLQLFGQNNQGEIIYEDKFNVHKNLPEEMADLKDRIPEFRTSKKILLFNSEEALYVNKPKTEEEKKKQQEFRGKRGGRGGGMRGRFGRMNRENNKLYTDLKEKSFVDSKDFFGKKFLVEGNREVLKWKMTGKQKQVGEYLCQQATYQDTSQTVEAWFTPMIPVATGPGNYMGLPGLVLHVDIDNGTRQITAIDIDLKKLAVNALEKPSEGKKMSQEEFNKLQDEKMEEMETEFGGSGNRRMMFRRG